MKVKWQPSELQAGPPMKRSRACKNKAVGLDETMTTRKQTTKNIIYLTALLLLAMALTGCWGSGPEPTPTPTKTPQGADQAGVAPTNTPIPADNGQAATGGQPAAPAAADTPTPEP